MLKNKFIKMSVVAFTVLVALWFATPQAFTKSLFSHKSNLMSMPQTELQSSAAEPSDLEEYKKPVYFNIFKFVNNFLPSKK